MDDPTDEIAPPEALSITPAPRPVGKAYFLPHLTNLFRIIHLERDQGLPGNNAFFSIDVDDVYLQALAPPASTIIWLEAVSARSNPELLNRITPQRDAILASLRFGPPGDRSPNYWQELDIKCDEDVNRAARLVVVALTYAYGIRDLGASVTRISRVALGCGSTKDAGGPPMSQESKHRFLLRPPAPDAPYKGSTKSLTEQLREEGFKVVEDDLSVMIIGYSGKRISERSGSGSTGSP